MLTFPATQHNICFQVDCVDESPIPSPHNRSHSLTLSLDLFIFSNVLFSSSSIHIYNLFLPSSTVYVSDGGFSPPNVGNPLSKPTTRTNASLQPSAAYRGRIGGALISRPLATCASHTAVYTRVYIRVCGVFNFTADSYYTCCNRINVLFAVHTRARTLSFSATDIIVMTHIHTL